VIHSGLVYGDTFEELAKVAVDALTLTLTLTLTH